MFRRQDRVDLHIHSTASDGVLSPAEVVHLALERQLTAIALVDHDTLAGIPEALDAAAGTGLEVVPGVEISAEGPWGDSHILGLYVDIHDEALCACLDVLRKARLRRARAMLKRLSALGMPLEWADVVDLATGGVVGRLHIARAMVQQGYVHSAQEAFQQYIGWNGPAYVPRFRITPQETIRQIRQAGGIAVLAHPAASGVVQHIPALVELGLQGVEVYYPDHSPEDVKVLLDLARRYRLLVTGGSDFHGFGPYEGAPLGSLDVPVRLLRGLQRAAGVVRQVT